MTKKFESKLEEEIKELSEFCKHNIEARDRLNKIRLYIQIIKPRWIKEGKAKT